MAISCKILLVFSPALSELITEPEFTPAKWQPLIEIQFNAPKLNIGATTPQLSLGSILNAAVTFTRALNIVSGIDSSNMEYSIDNIFHALYKRNGTIIQ